jgi:hypothetical protein
MKERGGEIEADQKRRFHCCECRLGQADRGLAAFKELEAEADVWTSPNSSRQHRCGTLRQRYEDVQASAQKSSLCLCA